LYIVFSNFDVNSIAINNSITTNRLPLNVGHRRIIFKQFFITISLFREKMKRLFLSLLTLACFMTATAQSLSSSKETTSFYTIQLGTYEASVKQADFEAIRSSAYIYKRDGVIFAGGFSSEELAGPYLEKIKAKGFDEAILISRPLKTAKTVYIVQIATKNAGEPITWKNYARVGTLYTIPNSGQVRIVHGSYADKNEANIKLKEIVELGFTDAFVRGVKDVQLNPITEFEVGDMSLLNASEATPVVPKPAFFVPKTTTTTATPIITKTTATTDVPFTPKSTVKTYNAPPAITTKRKSVIKLQDAMKDLGINVGASDGVFGKQTQVLYEKVLKTSRRLATYTELAQKHKGFEGWEDARLLMTMTRDLSVKDGGKAIVPDLFNNLPPETLSVKDASAALDWHTAVWKKLEIWSTSGQYNDQVYTALKVAYYRTLAHLEDHFASKGFTNEAGTAAAVSVLKTLIAADFEGFN
jgi:hypothetical protein